MCGEGPIRQRFKAARRRPPPHTLPRNETRRRGPSRIFTPRSKFYDKVSELLGNSP